MNYTSDMISIFVYYAQSLFKYKFGIQFDIVLFAVIFFHQKRKGEKSCKLGLISSVNLNIP